MSDAEYAALEARARASNRTLSEWVREVLLAAPTEPGVDAGEVALAEVLALRSLLLNLHYRASQGAAIPEAELRGLIERADATKLERARERLESVRAAVRPTNPEPEAAAETEPPEG